MAEARWEWWMYPLFLLAGAVLKLAWRKVMSKPLIVERASRVVGVKKLA